MALAATVEYFNIKYSLNIPKLHPENIVLHTKEEIKKLEKKRADLFAKRNTYLYF